MSEAFVLTDHHGLYTVEDLEALPDSNQRFELIDGALYVTPSPTPLHQRAAGRLRTLIDAALPVGWEAVEAIDIRAGEYTVLEPDVVVFRSAVVDLPERIVDPRDVALVAEVVSPSSVRMDRILKPQLYADAGIPGYLLIELEEPTVTWFVLCDAGLYERRGVASGGEVLRVSEPFAVDVVPAELVRAKG